ncbi:MAG: phage capsid protein [Azospirillaceae bacterium]
MATSITNAFVKQFEREVHEAYQRMGSKLRPTVRSKSSVVGASTTFQKVGKGSATTKTRHSAVTPMNIDHTPVECMLADYYAGDWVDKLDELKINIDERQVIANAGAYALGRKTDELIIDALATASQTAGAGGDGLTKAKVLEAFETLGAGDVPDDGERYAVVGWKQWSDLLAIDEFASSDYVGGDDLPWRGTQAKRWLGTLWIPHSGLPLATSVRTCFWYHKTAIGHASGADVETDISWHGDRAAHFVNSMMSQGACLIDDGGVVALPCLEG